MFTLSVTMTTLWNEKTLAEPPMCCTLVSINPENTGCLSTVREVLQECVSQLRQQPHLVAEVFVLAGLVYKKNSQLRRDKSLQALKLILKCFSRYKDINMYHIAMKLLEGFEAYSPGSFVKSVYLPSRQAMEHFLVKLMGVTCLLSQMVNYAVHAFILLHQRLCRGHLLPLNIVSLSSVSRVWAMCKSMALTFLSWYSRLLPVIQVLTPTEVKWLPDNDALPEDLAQFVLEVTGADIRTRDQDHNLLDMFDKIRNEHEEAMEDDTEVDTGPTELHQMIGHTKEEIDIHCNIEDIGVPIKKMRQLVPEEENVKGTPTMSSQLSSMEKGFDKETNNNLTNRKDVLGCVKRSHSFDELRSLLINLKKHIPYSQEFQTDWKTSLTTIKQFKNQFIANKERGEERIVNIRFLKKAKRSVRNLVNKYWSLTDTSDDQNANLSRISIDEENQEIKLEDTGETGSDHDPRSSPNLDLQRGGHITELKTKRKHLRKVIKDLRVNSHFEHEGKIIVITSSESEKLRKQLQQLLKGLKKLSCVKVRDFQRELELMNAVDSLLEDAAAEQEQKHCSELQTPKNLKNKRKLRKNKEGEQTGLIKMQKDETQVIKTKKLKELKKGQKQKR